MRPCLTLFLAAGIVATGALALGACGDDSGGQASPGGRLNVVATTVQVGALAREAGGDRINLRVLIGPGVDPHDYEATTSDLKTMRSAGVILRNGIGLDAFLDKAIKGSESRAAVVTVTDGIALRTAAGGSEKDPHVWHNPQNAKIMLLNITDALAKAEPAGASEYRQNAEAYAKVLDETDATIATMIQSIPPENRKMVTDHDAFGYFIDHYGLTFVGTVIPGVSTQAEPSARDLAALADTIKREKVKAIFAEGSMDPKVAQQIARDTGVKIVDDLYGDSLGEPGSEAATIHGMLLFNARRIAEALK
jgi:ABC-type Zn uptake system ZnuABC Zn-binding protein ZnuA